MLGEKKPEKVTILDVERRVDTIRIRDFGFAGVSTRVFPLKSDKTSARISGSISPEVWNMELGVNTGWRPEKDTNIKEFLGERGITDKGIFVVSDSTAGHEFGHPADCPKSLESYTFIRSAIAEELAKMGINSKDSTKYLANAYMDLVDNANRRAKGQHSEGLTIFYYTQGDSEFYSSFIELNMLAWGEEADRKLINRKFEGNFSKSEIAAIKKHAQEYAAQIGLGDLPYGGQFAEKSQAQKLAALNDAAKWEDQSRLFARKFGKLVQHQEPQDNDMKDKGGSGGEGGQDEKEGGKGDSKGEEKDGKGKGKQGEKKDGKGKSGEEGSGSGEKEDKEDGKGQGGSEEGAEDDEPEEAGKHMGKKQKPPGKKASGAKKSDKVAEPESGPGDNPFDSEVESPEGMKRALEKSVGAGKGIPKFMDSDEAVDLYYELIAKPIPVKDKPSNKGAVFPAAPFGAKEFDPTRDDPDLISGVMINDAGKPALQSYPDVFEINVPFVEKLVSHPDFCIAIDGSSSMQGGGGSNVVTSHRGDKAWGTESKYHYALKTAKGVMNHLRAENILPYVQTNSIVFSDKTIATGWQSYGDSAGGRTQMVRPMFGGTTLDPNVLEQQLGNRQPCVFILISDGAITNWAADGKKIMQILSRHYVAFIQIGEENTSGKDMKAAGFFVPPPVRSEKDLDSLVIDVASQFYAHIEGSQSASSTWLLPR